MTDKLEMNTRGLQTAASCRMRNPPGHSCNKQKGNPNAARMEKSVFPFQKKTCQHAAWKVKIWRRTSGNRHFLFASPSPIWLNGTTEKGNNPFSVFFDQMWKEVVAGFQPGTWCLCHHYIPRNWDHHPLGEDCPLPGKTNPSPPPRRDCAGCWQHTERLVTFMHSIWNVFKESSQTVPAALKPRYRKNAVSSLSHKKSIGQKFISLNLTILILFCFAYSYCIFNTNLKHRWAGRRTLCVRQYRVWWGTGEACEKHASVGFDQGSFTGCATRIRPGSRLYG